jgi:uroporphyrinogen decarboxylase
MEGTNDGTAFGKEPMNDGIHGMLPREEMSDKAKKIRDLYGIVPNAPFIQREFGFFSYERWEKEGHIASYEDISRDGGLEEWGKHSLGGIGWCEAAFEPVFEEKVLEDRGDYELVQDFAGRGVLCFKGRRSGFMPEYVTHPVTDTASWLENCKWRMNPQDPARYTDLDRRMETAVAAAKRGEFITQNLVGGYMYLRSLIGPEGLLYMFYDAPELVHDCMETWFLLADEVTSRHQKYVSLDEVFIGEDICYNHGSLISPDMIREFLFPYYKKLLDNAKKRQIDKERHLYFQVDTDGYCMDVLPLYMNELGMDVMSPFEAASNCDVVAAGREYPNLVMTGGFDKRILAKGKAAIDTEVDRIFPVMKKRGGYMPTCDHGVPEEVNYGDWVHFRKRCMEF